MPKKEEIRREIEALKQQLRMAGPEQAEALARKLGQHAADLKQLASDTASAGSSTDAPVGTTDAPVGTTSSQAPVQPATTTDAGTAESEGNNPDTAQSGADSLTSSPVSANPINTDTAPAGQSEANLAQSGEPQSQSSTEVSNQPGADDGAGEAVTQPEDAGTPPTDREKTVDAFEQIFAERQQLQIESEVRRQETDDLKFLAQELKLLAIQVEDKLEQKAELEEKDQLDHGGKDLKEALKDIDEVLSTGNDTLLASVAKPVAPIAQIQAYINVQEINVKV